MADDEAAQTHAEGSAIIPGYINLGLLQRGRDYETYDAWSRQRVSRCVVKILRGDRRRCRSSRSSLLLEGRLLTTLSHPHIVRGYEVRLRPCVAVVMETLGGATLRYILRGTKDRLATSSLVHLGDQLTSAVSYLHSSGYLHLDIKPSNIIVDGGRLRLIDLSLARHPGPVSRGTGTPGYLSPEQAVGSTVGVASDVWGIGLTMYEAAVGTNPYRLSGRNADGTLPTGTAPSAGTVCSTCGEAVSSWVVRQKAPSVRTGRRLPRALADAIDASLELAPADRPTVDELRATLRDLTSTPVEPD